MNLLLDVKRRRGHDQIAPVLLVLPAPDELRIEVLVATLVRHAQRMQRILLHDRLMFSGRDVLPLCLIVLQGLNRATAGSLFRHCQVPTASESGAESRSPG